MIAQTYFDMGWRYLLHRTQKVSHTFFYLVLRICLNGVRHLQYDMEDFCIKSIFALSQLLLKCMKCRQKLFGFSLCECSLLLSLPVRLISIKASRHIQNTVCVQFEVITWCLCQTCCCHMSNWLSIFARTNDTLQPLNMEIEKAKNAPNNFSLHPHSPFTFSGCVRWKSTSTLPMAPTHGNIDFVKICKGKHHRRYDTENMPQCMYD